MSIRELQLRTQALLSRSATLPRLISAEKVQAILHNARVLLVSRFEGKAITRAGAAALGISRRAWEWARALLRAAGIHDGRDVTEASFGTALAALEAAGQRFTTVDFVRAFIAPSVFN